VQRDDGIRNRRRRRPVRHDRLQGIGELVGAAKAIRRVMIERARDDAAECRRDLVEGVEQIARRPGLETLEPVAGQELVQNGPTA
jgi:hypothetical protein